MTNVRLKAIELSQQRPLKEFVAPSAKISDFYGENCFDLNKMKAVLSSSIFNKVMASVEHGERLDDETADAVAGAVKAWAIEKGATHYTHWFQPLTGSSAEKHDAFFDPYKGIEVFKGNVLIQQEPDASSFPNGGIRRTNQARGYTLWDPSSPIFIVQKTVCIPTIFVSYTGETLDYKAPLLKAVDAVDKAATAVCQYFDPSVRSVWSSLGIEQEYFLVDKAMYYARPDLYITGRTLFGHKPPRGQQLEDHYFGSIPVRVNTFMKAFEAECFKLGIPVKTRHNEVAPGQFEVAPIFEEVNTAVDHNLLMMDIMQKVADEYDFKVLLHEKPFAGLNGSGKHNNWSLITDTGRNLLDPEASLYFLTFLASTIKAVYTHADLLRASIASASNDHRLGANEAPPAIMSVFLGATLDQFLNELEETGLIRMADKAVKYMELGIGKLPGLKLDNTDRNRTSPFAFTGNKFEFRAVGSSQNSATAMTVLNLIMADQLLKFKEELDSKLSAGYEKEEAIRDIVIRYIKESKAIRFEGDGYSDEWVEEASRRGLSNVKDTPRALDFLTTPSAQAIFGKYGVFSEKELTARQTIWLEIYSKKIDIESRTMQEIALTKILPASANYMLKLVEAAKGASALGVQSKGLVATIQQVSDAIDELKSAVTEMASQRNAIHHEGLDVREEAIAFCDRVKEAYFERIRIAADVLEQLVDDSEWPLPRYSEMLILK